MPVCEIHLQPRDSAEPLIVKDFDLIKQMPVVLRAVELENPDWETTDTILATPLPIPFEKETMEFMFNNMRRYKAPAEDDFETKAEDYPEAYAKDVYDLKPIIELANYTENTDFMNCIGFVIAKKLEKMSIESIAEFLGVECLPEGNFFDEKDGWIHAPAELFEAEQPQAAGAAPQAQ
ncbi:hypothetical protein L5515_005466 [Caenorhabditis briggsae]|uniref:Uncharacterized protein n=1 Tax=Caenorhabditis briggsae TaxID=6238 RepID=A0AAE9JF01_CAEBR|nr:hypothetical protein L5515_005466 [Caenorhabditis briggsae]